MEIVATFENFWKWRGNECGASIKLRICDKQGENPQVSPPPDLLSQRVAPDPQRGGGFGFWRSHPPLNRGVGRWRGPTSGKRRPLLTKAQDNEASEKDNMSNPHHPTVSTRAPQNHPDPHGHDGDMQRNHTLWDSRLLALSPAHKVTRPT